MEIVDHKCATCGASLEYDIKTKNWKCKFCRSSNLINNLKKRKKSVNNLINELICPTCNAKLLVNENVISTKCVYCRSNVVVSKTNEEIAMPDKIIPFSITKDDAKYILFSTLNEKKLLPDDFDLEKNITDIQGIYVPFWLFSNKYKVVIRDKNLKILKKINLSFKLIPYDANKHLDNKITKSLEPFNYEELVNFDSSYLSGVLAQKYDILGEKGEKDINKRCEQSLYDIFTDKYSKFYIYNAKMINETLISQDMYYALLPIWLLNIKYHKKDYLIAINGQTGKLAGDLPVDRKSYTKIAVGTYIIVFAILVVLFLILRWLGVFL